MWISYLISGIAILVSLAAVVYARRQVAASARAAIAAERSADAAHKSASAAERTADLHHAEIERKKYLVSFRWRGSTPSIVNEGTEPVMLNSVWFKRWNTGTQTNYPFGERLDAGASREFDLLSSVWDLQPSDRVAVHWRPEISGADERVWESAAGTPHA